MATAKKSGAPASASKPERQKRKSSDELKAIKQAEREARKAAFQKESKAIRKAAQQCAIDDANFVHSARADDAPVNVWSDALGKALFGLISVGLSMDKISRRPGMPELKTMIAWLGDPDHPFGKTYMDAKALLVPLYEERAQDAALDATRSEIVTTRYSDKDGESREVRIVDNVERAKLIVAAYQWTLSHLKPKKHGRNADPESGRPNDQLKALFDSLKQGPAE